MVYYLLETEILTKCKSTCHPLEYRIYGFLKSDRTMIYDRLNVTSVPMRASRTTAYVVKELDLLNMCTTPCCLLMISWDIDIVKYKYLTRTIYFFFM